MLKVSKFLIVTVFLLIVLAVIYILFLKLKIAGDVNLNFFQSNTPTKSSEYNLSYAAWIPYWDTKAGITSLEKTQVNFEIISPVWYEVKDDGTLQKKNAGNKEKFVSLIKNRNIKLIPAIAMFDHEIFSKVLQNEKNLERHIEEIYQLVVNENFDGIDLDYESTKLSDKDQYFIFLEMLSEKLHKINKTLIITVLAKWNDDKSYASLPETRIVQDWTRIAEFADQIRIMAYDYTNSKSQFPGPIAPLNWIKDILEYAVNKIPREKIILGIHLYAYEWWLEVDPTNKDQEFSSLTFITNYLLNNSSDKAARAYTYDTVLKVLAENQGERSEYQGEQILEYQKINSVTNKLEYRILIYIDPAGVRQREQLAKVYQIAGVSYWRLGSEADLLEN